MTRALLSPRETDSIYLKARAYNRDTEQMFENWNCPDFFKQ